MAMLWLLHLLVLSPLSLCTNPGITVRLTQKGLEYGRQIGIAVLQQKLKSVHIPDISGKESVSPVGSVEYSLSGMQVVSLGLPQSSLVLAPGSGLSLSIGNAYISIDGNWRVKYLKFIKDHGSFDLSVSELTISAVMAVGSDETGRPTVSCTSCSASVGSAKIKFHGGASWLYNLFSSFIDKALRNALQDKLCPLVTDAIAGINPHLKTLNVLAKVDQYAEIEYSMVSSPVITKDYIDLNLKGEFYNIGKHQEPPFPAPGFSLPAQANSMLYFGVSQFTPNSAGFVYSTTGVLSINVTDDMVCLPPSQTLKQHKPQLTVVPTSLGKSTVTCDKEQYIPPFFLTASSHTGSQGCWSLSQQPTGTRQDTPWTGRQSISGQTHTHTRVGFPRRQLTYQYVFGLWEETGAPGGNPCECRETIQTPHR